MNATKNMQVLRYIKLFARKQQASWWDVWANDESLCVIMQM